MMQSDSKISEYTPPEEMSLDGKEVPLQAGVRIFNRFTLVSELGRGRCSATWLAEDPRFRRQSVVKIFRSSNAHENDEESASWRDFLRRLRILNHPDIVITMEFFNEGPRLALSSAFESGPSLASITLQAGHKLALAQIESVLKTVGAALVAAFEKGRIVHGNLNAFNILIPARRTNAKITDFGFHPPLPSWPNEESVSPDLSWKLACYSRERLQGAPPSHADDAYAFGALGFQLFTGKNPPLMPDGAVDISEAEKLLTGSPESWTRPLLAALAPDIAERPKKISQILGDLLDSSASDVSAQESNDRLSSDIARVKIARPKKIPKRERPKRAFLLRLVLALSTIAAPVAIFWVVQRSMATDRELRKQRVQDEIRERALEEQADGEILQLETRLGKGNSPSRESLDLYRKALDAPMATPKPTPVTINSNAKAFYEEGRAKMAKGMPAEAMIDYELAVVLQPNWVDLFEARGEALIALKKPSEAILEYGKALVADPVRQVSLLGRARAHLANKDEASAKTDLENALKLNPENPDAKALLETIKGAPPGGAGG